MIFLHIGLQKTGTTSLQFLLEKENLLRFPKKLDNAKEDLTKLTSLLKKSERTLKIQRLQDKDIFLKQRYI